jgi:hypothetical protein
MPAAAVRILVVGRSTTSTESTLKVLARSGWESHAVKTVREAHTVLRTIRFQLTLATEKLPDGTGYELAPLVVQQSGNLFIAVPLTETCLWLPAVENGTRSLGVRALNPLMLATELEGILRTCDTTIAMLERAHSRQRSSGGEVVRAAGEPAVATEDARGDRFELQANRRFTHGENVILPGAIAPRRRVLAAAEKSREHASRRVYEDLVGDLEVLSKHWRGF